MAACVAASCQIASAQTNPAAHYANGQVWVVWTVDSAVVSGMGTYAIYRAATPFTDVADATLVGRLFYDECTGALLTDAVSDLYGSPLLTGFKIPAAGSGTYTLAANQGVFAETVRNSGSAYYAVVPFGQTTVAPTEITGSAISYTFDLNDPPKPYLQVRDNTSNGFVAYWAIWVDGDQDDNGGRPDFPVFGNAAKRGAAHTFLMVEPLGGLPGSGPWPATVSLHGGNSRANVWLPREAESVDTYPTDGFLISFDDDMFRKPNGESITTGHFGYAREFDPFGPNLLPPGSTIVNYTQRRNIWVLEWLAANGYLDKHRITLIGHSNGAQGAMMLARAFPEHFSNVLLFNCTMRLYDEPALAAIYGTASDNFETSIRNAAGEPVRMLEVTRFAEHISPVRDLPFFRHYAGKCDDNNQQQWGPIVLDQMRWSDANAIGLHFYWDLRKHGLNEWQDYWVDATSPATLANQTRRDDVRNQSRYRNDQSYPAFFNVQNYADHGDPGPGYIGANSTPSPCGLAKDENDNLVANGDDRGTWGGYFDWEPATIVDTNAGWQCTAFLVGSASGYAPIDESPHAQLTADIAIRRPQRFHPAPGTAVLWSVRAANTNNILQSGIGTVDTDGLVKLTGVTVLRDPDRVVIQASGLPAVGIAKTSASEITLSAFLRRGFTYQLQSRTSTSVWIDIGLPVAGGDATVEIPRPITTSAEFYRLRITATP